MRKLLFISVIFLSWYSHAQTDSVQQLPVLAKITSDSITLRWAPTDHKMWVTGNNLGYIIEKFLLIQNGVVLDPPVKISLTNDKVKVFKEEDWSSVVQKERDAMVVVQALYGTEFNLSIGKNNVFEIVNKRKENAQRFSIALLYADQSMPIALASGLAWTDHNTVPGEKYLYRVSLINDDRIVIAAGAIFVEADDITILPEPLIENAFAMQGISTLVLDLKSYQQIYNSFILERSVDSLTFAPTATLPYAEVAESDLPDKTYLKDTLSHSCYYRVRGVTPFGDYGPPSRIIHAINKVRPEVVPVIRDLNVEANGFVNVSWEFPDSLNQYIGYFQLERAESKSGPYQMIAQANDKQHRMITDGKPATSNYYRIVGLTRWGDELTSQTHFIHLVDSLPPSAPQGIIGSIEANGNVKLFWQKPPDDDILGYRIYKSHFKIEEPSALTKDLVLVNEFTDAEDLNTLNRHVYYYLMTVDKSQNQSPLSKPVKISLPDKVPPQPATGVRAKSDSMGIMVTWKPSASEDVQYYEILRTSNGTWESIYTLPARRDTLYYFTDLLVKEGMKYNYTIVAIDSADLPSEPANPVSVKRLSTLKPAPQMLKPEINREKMFVKLRWKALSVPVIKYQVYRKSAQSKDQYVLYTTISGDLNEFKDTDVKPGKTYSYFLVAVFSNVSYSIPTDHTIIEF